MSELTLPAAGRCRCDEVEIRLSTPPILTMACHCKGCQRMSASAFSLSVAIPATARGPEGASFEMREYAAAASLRA
jgi:hypothetical protein